jgi:UDP-N-acetylglucosamine 2-epimerase
MKKLKVVTVVGTRPEIIRLSEVIKTLELFCDHSLVHTGQNFDFELNEIFFKDLSINKPDYFLNAAGKSAAATIGNVISKSDEVFSKIKPDALLILGDTNSALTAISAKRKKIPIFHMEAGNRCFDLRVPEEINRKIVDHVSDINLPYSQIAREYLLREGISPDRVIVTGSPMKEVLMSNLKKINASKILSKLNLRKNKYFLVSVHREENVDDLASLKKFFTILENISKKYKLPVIVSTHPRTKNNIDKAKIKTSKNINLLKPLGFNDYNCLQLKAKAVLSDSGTITEESSILNFPALNIRTSNERPEGFEEGAVMMVGFNEDRIMQALKILDNKDQNKIRDVKEVADYNVDNVSQKVLRIIHSYTDYVDRKVWQKKK